ncbi:hypothetical protein [Pelomonas cellulosilytica]|uniref:Uncharacterized protein n=1 Tax=Pelomonas cellulosilytica TaxID=2906762 RepID=A0ABS8XS24_9BURK|nr:hypothetical protein [Pelomonas sp. P8]MCE4555514.1 hypothetical protein [Pelomonas sp. P8]
MNTYVIGGGCGFRDFPGKQNEVVVNFAGPRPSEERSKYARRATNSSLFVTHTLRVTAVCASATTVTGP